LVGQSAGTLIARICGDSAAITIAIATITEKGIIVINYLINNPQLFITKI
jgi:hypothetical protein